MSIRTVVTGAAGYMGRILLELLESDERFQVVGAVDPAISDTPSLESIREDYDLIIDFSRPEALTTLLDAAKAKGSALVIATTGHTDDQKKDIGSASKDIPIFFASNMSLGVALLSKSVKELTAALPTADIEIVETHHSRKVDSPSGTALTLAQAAKDVRPDLNIISGRSGEKKREKNDLCISSLRFGDVVGIHEVIFGLGSQTITLKHEAHDRRLFAEGALEAGNFIVTKPAGLYNMDDLLGEI